jgi:hypothetical protein
MLKPGSVGADPAQGKNLGAPLILFMTNEVPGVTEHCGGVDC